MGQGPRPWPMAMGQGPHPWARAHAHGPTPAAIMGQGPRPWAKSSQLALAIGYSQSGIP